MSARARAELAQRQITHPPRSLSASVGRCFSLLRRAGGRGWQPGRVSGFRSPANLRYCGTLIRLCAWTTRSVLFLCRIHDPGRSQNPDPGRSHGRDRNLDPNRSTAGHSLHTERQVRMVQRRGCRILPGRDLHKVFPCRRTDRPCRLWDMDWRNRARRSRRSNPHLFPSSAPCLWVLFHLRMAF